MSPDQNTPPAIPDDEIDLLALAKTFWAGRRILFKTILAFGVLGFIVAITTPKEFVATTVMVPSGTSGSSNLGGLGGLAAMAGININTSSGAELSPVIYPKIVTSLPFQLELMKTPLTFSDKNDPVTFYDYYSAEKKSNPFVKYTIGLPGLILSLPGQLVKAIRGEKKENISSDKTIPIELTEKQKAVQLLLSKLVTLEANAKEGFLTLSVTMPEAKAAAQLGQRAQAMLQLYITEFKIKKAQAQLLFIQQRYDETSKKLEISQERLASFSDRNKNVSTATAKIEYDKLNRDYNLVYGVYSELAKQLEQAKIQVKQDTPVFTIIEPISVPTTKSKPNRPMILLIWLFLGGVVGTGFIFGKEYWASVKEKWNSPVTQ